MPHRDQLIAAQARIEALEHELEMAREQRADLARFASFHAELEALRAENEALQVELASVRQTLSEERAARHGTAASERATREQEVAALREQVAALRRQVTSLGHDAAAARAEAARHARPFREQAEPDPASNVRRVDPDRVAQGGACPVCHAESALTSHPAGSGLASVVCRICGYVELRT